MDALRIAPALLTIVALAVGGGCGDASGCGDFNPKSDRIDEGETVDVTVRVANGALWDLDVAGDYWTPDQRVQLADGEYDAQATLTRSADAAGGGIVTLDLGAAGMVTFNGPIFCE